VSTPTIVPVGAIYVHEGVTTPIVTDVEIPAGNVVVLGKLVGIAKYGICENSRGSITVAGVFDVVKDPTTNIPAGTILYWSKISFHVIKNAYAHSMIGVAVAHAPAGSRSVKLRLKQ
jgi:predicted RecA/RadA family phage recombinase